jgi:hypothetical protein
LDNLSGQTFPGGAKLNDGISSIRVEGGAEVYVHADARFRGAVLRLTESARNLTGRLLPGSATTSWNDRISSLRVERRRRDEPRAEPEVIIQRAYLDLLGREPDPVGLRDYRSLILDQGWSERMVRDNIRRGDEYPPGRRGADRAARLPRCAGPRGGSRGPAPFPAAVVGKELDRGRRARCPAPQRRIQEDASGPADRRTAPRPTESLGERAMGRVPRGP